MKNQKQMRMWAIDNWNFVKAAGCPEQVDEAMWRMKGYRWIRTKRSWAIQKSWHHSGWWKQVEFDDLPELMQMAIRAREL